VDWELFLAIGFVLLGSAGFVYAGLAAYYYILRERRETNGVPAALIAFGLQYCLAFAMASEVVRLDLLLPLILMFLTAIALMIAVWFGFRAHSRAGTRIAFAELFTLGAYLCIAPHLF
jgi:hypothetical protein